MDKQRQPEPATYIQVVTLPSRFSHVVIKLVDEAQIWYYGFMPDKSLALTPQEGYALLQGKVIEETEIVAGYSQLHNSAKLPISKEAVSLIQLEVIKLNTETIKFYHVSGWFGTWNCLNFIYHVFALLGYPKKHIPLKIQGFSQLVFLSSQRFIANHF